MPFVYRQNGNLVEITETEKAPTKVRVRPDHIRRRVRPLHRARRRDNLVRTRQICVRRVSAGLAAFGTPLLATLTFQGDASDAAYANDSIRRFQVRLRAFYPQAESIFVPELSPRGRIHFHGLIFNVPLSLGDTRSGRVLRTYGEEREQRTLARLWGEGFVDVVKTDGSGRLASYIAKYITKGGGDLVFAAMRLIRISRGFPKEILERGEVAEELAHRYASSEPIRAWEGENPFLGKVSKKTYTKL